jgi:hypothetical protein
MSEVREERENLFPRIALRSSEVRALNQSKHTFKCHTLGWVCIRFLFIAQMRRSFFEVKPHNIKVSTFNSHAALLRLLLIFLVTPIRFLSASEDNSIRRASSGNGVMFPSE